MTHLARIVIVFALLAHAVPASAQEYVLLAPSDAHHAVTLGLLQGGGGLVGIDYEQAITDHVGVQAGVGAISFGCGLTYHPQAGTRNRHWFLGYWNQGYAHDQSTRYLGITHVWRSASTFTMQLGIGAVLLNTITDTDVPAVALFSIGICPTGTANRRPPTKGR